MASHRCAELFEHGFQHVVVEQAQPAVADLQGDVTVAQVVGGAGQFQRAGAGDVEQTFGAGDDPHQATVAGLQAVAVGQRRLAALEEQADLLAARREAAQAALAARLVGQVEFFVPAGERAGRRWWMTSMGSFRNATGKGSQQAPARALPGRCGTPVPGKRGHRDVTKYCSAPGWCATTFAAPERCARV